MNPLEAIKICVVKKPLSFRGTESKCEFWGFALPYALFFLGIPFLTQNKWVLDFNNLTVQC